MTIHPFLSLSFSSSFFLIKVVMNRIREEGCINYIDKTWWKIDFVRNIIFVPRLALKCYIYIYTIVTLNRMELLFNFINLLRNILRDIMFYTFIVLRVCRDFSLFFLFYYFCFCFLLFLATKIFLVLLIEVIYIYIYLRLSVERYIRICIAGVFKKNVHLL